MAKLGVNIDHVATVRQARRTYEPDPVWAAVAAELGGADGITVHLREDRRHIQDRDLRILRETVTVKLNLELACTSDVLAIACQLKPDQATLVPERREEVTTEGGLNVHGSEAKIGRAISQLHDAGIVVSLFLDPDAAAIQAARKLGADAVELHTGQYALRAKPSARRIGQIDRGRPHHHRPGNGAARGARADVPQRPARRHDPGMCELNIGHSIVARAVMVGFQAAVREMKELVAGD